MALTATGETGMSDKSPRALRQEMDRLERQVDALVRHCARLEEENRVLREARDSLNAERASLLEKNEQARSKIESMIGRLKAMENS